MPWDGLVEPWCSVCAELVSQMGNTIRSKGEDKPSTQTASITTGPPFLDGTATFDVDEDAAILDADAIGVLVGG